MIGNFLLSFTLIRNFHGRIQPAGFIGDCIHPTTVRTESIFRFLDDPHGVIGDFLPFFRKKRWL